MGWFDSLFGGGGKDVNWGDMERIMDMENRMSRNNINGLFTNTKWEEGDNGQWTQTQQINPLMQAGMDRLMQRVGGGQSGLPPQMMELMEAKMAQQMQRHGIGRPSMTAPGSLYGQNPMEISGDYYGPRYGQQQMQGMMPPPPPQGPPQGGPPQGPPQGGPPQGPPQGMGGGMGGMAGMLGGMMRPR